MVGSLSNRSQKKELLDAPDIPVQDLYLNLDELHLINKRLGGYSVSKKGLAQIAEKKKLVKNVLDVGFGGGHSILELSSNDKDQLFFYGVDLKQECVDYAERTLSKVTRKSLICNDYKNLEADLLKHIDVIHCSLFLHHLSNEEIVEFFKKAKHHGCIVLVNDLHRNWFAYYSIKFITALFSASRLVKHDAAVSVARGFRKKELVKLLELSGYKNYTVRWCWAFRYLIIAEN